MNLGSSYPQGYFEPRFEQGDISKVVHRAL